MSDIAKLIQILANNNLRLATAESCTGGSLAAAVTSVPGASLVFDCGIVSYSNDIKEKLLSVPGDILQNLGAVSRETACAMAAGALNTAKADIALSTTGIAGPGGGTEAKPVGLVYIGLADRNKAVATKNRFEGSREEIRRQTVMKAFDMLAEYLKEKGLE